MISSTGHANQILMNKYCWMAKQMRNFNDRNSIIQWSNAMMFVKNLLLDHQDTYSHHSPTTIKGSLGNPLQVYSVSKPTTLSFQPLSKPYCILTPSSTPSVNFAPHKPSPLSLHHPYRLSIQPTSTPNYIQPPPIKKRKTMLPPQVEIISTTTHQTTAPNPTIFPLAKPISPPSSNPPTASPMTDQFSLRKSKREKAVPIARLHLKKLASRGEEYMKELALLTRDAAKANMDRLSYLSNNRNEYPLCSWYYY